MAELITNGTATTPRKLWSHPNPKTTEIYKFKSHIAHKYNLTFSDETDAENSLWRWSVDHIPEFWSEVWDRTGIRASRKFENVVDIQAPMFPRPTWFRGAKLNFAENLLFPTTVVDEDSVAVVVATERGREKWTWRDLRERVRVFAAALSGKVKVGDRVVGFVGNHAEALVAMLATTSLGGIWSGVSPDNGSTSVLDRWTQLEPVVLLADNAVYYNGKAHDSMGKLVEIVKGLPTLKHVVVLRKYTVMPIEMNKLELSDGQAWLDEEFLGSAVDSERLLRFKQLDPDWPVYILFSSGTTGKPKCICHGAIGTLIQHKKEHMLHCDMKPGDVFFQYTTVTWMMWHWLVSGLASGVTIVLYDGSPFRPLVNGSGDLAMPKLIEELGVTHFGTSAKYLSILEQNNARPKEKFALKSLKAIYSTAAVLAPSTFEYVYDAFGPNINLGSITGGTDIISLFGAPSPLVPVHSGEIQCIGLGMKVESWNPSGKPCESGEAGDLVCTFVFPCMPVRFWGANGDSSYKRSYFETFPGVWHHGDFLKISPTTRGMIMLGRSDGLLKPSGVRFGSAEIYNLLLSFFPTQISDALCVGRRRATDVDEAVVLFLLMAPGEELNDEFRGEVKRVIARELSARHVPAFVESCPEIPVTTNGKKVEVAVKQILSGWDVKVSASVANAEVLEWYRKWGEDH
ncbi:acetoacetate-CoA ligase [Wilcoxina mikolae CBS 423.85]|nr:acetoacetate-CoA ligase [Wilcoxina mikolae CBS 423.85]